MKVGMYDRVCLVLSQAISPDGNENTNSEVKVLRFKEHLFFYLSKTFKCSYNCFKIDIHQQLRPLTANYLAMFKVISTTIYT